MTGDEFVLVLQRALERSASEPLGGRGGGVQVLAVVEARARTFDHLFLVGMNRDVFPRTIQEDPLLPDGVRRPLAEVLPDLAEKAAGHDEERFLFAQLLSSSPYVSLSWQASDEEGKARAPSTLVERLRGQRQDTPVRKALPLHGAAAVAGDVEVSAQEHALAAGLHGSRAQFETALRVAFAERHSSLADVGLQLDPARVAAGRLAVLNEVDRGAAGAPSLGPFFGFIGPVLDDADPRRRLLYVTRLEAVARCPWQAFVERLLRVEPVPDPLAALPSVDALQVGSVTHAVLQRVANSTGAGAESEKLEEALAQPAHEMRWPGDATVQGYVREIGAKALKEEGLDLPGLLRVLEVIVWRHLQVARDLEWPGPESAVSLLGAEVEGSCLAEDREVRFRADRVDAGEHGPVLVDYKTGRPAVKVKTAKSRHEKLVRGIREGRLLQGFAYAKSSEGARGRYLYLSPRDGAEIASIFVDAGDAELAEAFEHCVSRVLAALDQGALPPRLLAPDRQKAASACQWCNVSEACVYGDSGARARLRDWLAAWDEGPEPSDPAERAALDVLRLHGQGDAR
jgi:RecB family exonuclease